jgi:hypothetical protein
MRAVRGEGGVRYEVCLSRLESPLLVAARSWRTITTRNYTKNLEPHVTYDHRTLKTSSPVRSAVCQGTVLGYLCPVSGIQDPVGLTIYANLLLST